MSSRSKTALPRQGYSKYGFKISKPRSKTKNAADSNPPQSRAQSSTKAARKIAQSPADTPAATGTTTGKKSTDRTDAVVGRRDKGQSTASKPEIAPSTKPVPRPSTTAPKTAVRGIDSLPVLSPRVIDLTATDSPEPALRKSSSESSTKTPAQKLRTSKSAGRVVVEAGALHTEKALQAEAVLTANSGSPQGVHETSLINTPLWIRQLRKAAHFPDVSSGQHMETEWGIPTTSTAGSIPENDGWRNQSTTAEGAARPESYREASLISAIEPFNLTSRLPYALNPTRDSSPACSAGLTLTSTPPQLISSLNADYDEYVITTTYRIPKSSSFVSPRISFTLPTPISLPFRNGDVAHPPVSNHSHQPTSNRSRQPTLSVINTASSTSAGLSLEKEIPLARRAPPKKPPRARTPTPFHRGSSFRHLTPRRSHTPSRRTTRAESIATARRTATLSPAMRKASTLFKGTTPRRKQHWHKLIPNMAEYQRRRALVPRRPVFTQPIQEPHLTLPRLNKFWNILSDLIADKKLFSRGVFEHWEKLGTCVRLVNKRVREGEMFGERESRAVARELGRQRLLIVAGGDTVMLTRNAMSTRLS